MCLLSPPKTVHWVADKIVILVPFFVKKSTTLQHASHLATITYDFVLKSENVGWIGRYFDVCAKMFGPDEDYGNVIPISILLGCRFSLSLVSSSVVLNPKNHFPGSDSPAVTQSKQRPVCMFKIYFRPFRSFSLKFQSRFVYKHQLGQHELAVGSSRDCIRLKIPEILACRCSFARSDNSHEWRLRRYCPVSRAAHVHTPGR